VIVNGDASYLSVIVDKAPSPNTKKADIVALMSGKIMP
jgi:hypothetical protein